jgi:hypothetical protein
MFLLFLDVVKYVGGVFFETTTLVRLDVSHSPFLSSFTSFKRVLWMSRDFDATEDGKEEKNEGNGANTAGCPAAQQALQRENETKELL